MDQYLYNINLQQKLMQSLKINVQKGSGSRWHRNILNSPYPIDILNLQLHMKQLPLKETQKQAELLLHIGMSRKGWDTILPQTSCHGN